MFKAFGHRNILGTHETTIEFTKDKCLTKKGNCILGISADFKLDKIKKFIIGKKKVKITLISNNFKDSLTGTINQKFNDSNEIVIRKSNFKSKRTLIINASKGSIDIDRNLVSNLIDENKEVFVKIILRGCIAN